MKYVIEFRSEQGRGRMGADEPMEVGDEFGHKGRKVVVTACREVNVPALRVYLQGGNYLVPHPLWRDEA